MQRILDKMTKAPMGLPLMFEAWSSCMDWAMRKEEIRDRFIKETSLDIPGWLNTDALEIENLSEQDEKLIIAFCDWATEWVWGLEEDYK